MPRHAKGPRLYLRKRSGRDAIWVIRDGAAEHGTGCAFGDSAGAARALEDYLSKKHRPGLSGRANEVEVSDVLSLYSRNVAPKVKRPDVLLYTVDTLNKWWGGGKRVSEIKGHTCRAYGDWRRGQAWAHAKTSDRVVGDGTVRRELETLRAAVKHYHAEIGLDAVPTVTMPDKSQPRERWLTRDEVAKLLRAARAEAKAQHLIRFILIGVYTGTRHDAMLRLGWTQNVLGGWIDVDRGLIYRRAEGAARTRKSQTPARLPNRLLAHLRRWRRADAAAGRNLVVNYHGDAIKKIRRSWDTACSTAGLGEDVVPHTMRHTAATWMMQANVDMWLAAGVLAMTVQTLEETYGHHHGDFQKGIVNAF